MLYGIFKGCLIEKIPGVRTGLTKYTAMTGQNIGFAFLTPTEQIIAQDQTEHDNAKSKKVIT